MGATDRRHGAYRPNARIRSRPLAWKLRLLSGFELRADDDLVVLPSTAQRLLAYLAVRERPQLRSTAAATLWLDTTDDRAAASLRTVLWKLNQLGGGLVRVDGAYLSLAAETEVDLVLLTRVARRLVDQSELGPPSTFDVDALCGDLLPDWDEDWIIFERERLRQLRMHALESLAQRLSRCGRHAEAIDAAQAAVAVEPLRDSAQRVLIGVHMAEGNVVEARRQYDSYRALLWEYLALEPSAELRAVAWPDALTVGKTLC